MSLQGKIDSQGGSKGDLIHLWPAELLQGISEAPSPEGVSAYQTEPLHSELEADGASEQLSVLPFAIASACIMMMSLSISQ